MVKIVETLKYNSEWNIKFVTRVTFWSLNLWNLGPYLEQISMCPTEGCIALPCTTFIMWCCSYNDIFKYLLMEPHFRNSFLRPRELELWGHCAVCLSVCLYLLSQVLNPCSENLAWTFYHWRPLQRHVL